jgi:hypothetical protein
LPQLLWNMHWVRFLSARALFIQQEKPARAADVDWKDSGNSLARQA